MIKLLIRNKFVRWHRKAERMTAQPQRWEQNPQSKATKKFSAINSYKYSRKGKKKVIAERQRVSSVITKLQDYAKTSQLVQTSYAWRADLTTSIQQVSPRNAVSEIYSEFIKGYKFLCHAFPDLRTMHLLTHFVDASDCRKRCQQVGIRFYQKKDL